MRCPLSSPLTQSFRKASATLSATLATEPTGTLTAVLLLPLPKRSDAVLTAALMTFVVLQRKLIGSLKRLQDVALLKLLAMLFESSQTLCKDLLPRQLPPLHQLLLLPLRQ